MNKKFLGIKLSTYLTAFLCLVAAFLLWLLVNMNGELSEEKATAILHGLTSFIC